MLNYCGPNLRVFTLGHKCFLNRQSHLSLIIIINSFITKIFCRLLIHILVFLSIKVTLCLSSLSDFLSNVYIKFDGTVLVLFYYVHLYLFKENVFFLKYFIELISKKVYNVFLSFTSSLSLSVSLSVSLSILTFNFKYI